MSSCELKVDLGRQTYRSGERIAGSVVVRTDADVRSKRLWVELEWRTRGRGNVAKQTVDSATLCEAIDWSAGHEYRYPFELTAPPGPLSYEGHLLQVGWHVRARADVPWAIDPKAAESFHLEAGDGESYALGPDADPVPTREGAATARATPTWVMGLVSLIASAMLVGGFVLLSSLRGDPLLGSSIPTGIAGAVLTIAGLAFLIGIVRKAMTQGKIGTPEVRISPGTVHAGEELSVDVTVRPRSSVTIDAIDATLTCEEVVVSGSGTNKTTHHHVVSKLAQTMSGGGRTLEIGQTETFATRFRLADDSPATFVAPSNSLRWSVHLRARIPGWPDWFESYPIAVLPKRRSRNDVRDGRGVATGAR